MTDPMKPTDVPKDLALIAAARLREWPHSGTGEELGARRILAAVLPLHEQQIRARVMAELQQESAHERWIRGDGV